MNDIMRPWHVLLAVLAGWIHHRQQKMIEFQNDQIESLLKQLAPLALSEAREAGTRTKEDESNRVPTGRL